MTTREYRYVGSSAIREVLPSNSGRLHVQSGNNVLRWLTDTHQSRELDGSVVATFIIDTHSRLWINDRRSEHVLCAAGGNVLSAGEITFARQGKTVIVSAATNQSTGYCPEPESWYAVDAALSEAKIEHPTEFTTAFIFRRCESCAVINLVKDDWFVCAVCDALLPERWNFDARD